MPSRDDTAVLHGRTPARYGAGGEGGGSVSVEGELPPLELQAELVFPDGTTARWDAQQPLARNQPTGITFKTQRYTGFTDAQLTLARRIDLDYPDLGLLDGVNLIGHSGSVAFEGYTGSMPRSLQSSPAITLQVAGWMSHAKDQPFTEVYVDRDLSKWTNGSASRSLALITANRMLGSFTQTNDESGSPAVELSFGGPWVTPYTPFTEAWWGPVPGVNVGIVFCALKNRSPQIDHTKDAHWSAKILLTDNDETSGAESSGELLNSTSGYLTASATQRAAVIQLTYTETAKGEAGATYSVWFEKLAVYGTHGVQGRGEDPQGFYVSDMIRNIASRWAPKLDTSGVEETTFPVPHASFLSETLPYDAFQTLNAYHRWEIAVYEKRRLLYYPINLNDWDWEVRAGDAGTTVELQGDEAGALANGVIVRYTDLGTGYETRLTPESHSELRDDSPDNPANLNGRKLYTDLSLSAPTTEEGALQMGRAYLAEFNQAKAPGSITVTGHIRDRAGHWQQGWKVRAGDRLVIGDQANPQVRVVGETSWDHDRKQLTIAVDSQFKRLDAILARLGVALEASNLSLP